MKKIIAILMLMIMSLSMVAAQTATPVTTQAQTQTGTGINPDSPLWGLDKALDNLWVRLQFNEQSRAREALKVATERQEEAQMMLDMDKPEAAQKAIANWEEHVATAEQMKLSLRNKGEDEDADQIDTNVRNRVQILNQVRERFLNDDNPNNDNALKGIENAIEHVEMEREREGQPEPGEDSGEEEDEHGSGSSNSPSTTGRPAGVGVSKRR